MSDYLAPTALEVPTFCPACYPDRDPRTFVPTFCAFHGPSLDGLDDARVANQCPINSAEAGGEDNAAWCSFIHRRRLRASP